MMAVCDPGKGKDMGTVGTWDLVVEVLSSGTARNDRGHKKNVYERHGVQEYGLVNPADFTVEQYLLRDGQFVLRDIYHKYAEGGDQQFSGQSIAAPDGVSVGNLSDAHEGRNAT